MQRNRTRLHAALIAPLCAASLAAASPAPVPTDSQPVPTDSHKEPVPTDSQPVPTDSSSPSAPTREGPDLADDRQTPRLAIVRPQLTGFTNPALADTIAAQLHSGMQRGRVRVLADVARAAGDECDDSCLRRLRTDLGADFVLRTTVRLVDRDYIIRLELVDNSTRTAVAHREATCELCGLGELRTLAADQVSRIVGLIDDVIHPPPRLHLETFPLGVIVHIDGRLAGTTPFDAPIPAGARVIRLSRAGYITEQLPVTAAPGVHERIQVNLRRLPETAKARRGGFALLFTGLATAMAGVTLLSLDGQPQRSRCDGPDIDIVGNCRYRFDTDIGGAVLLGASAVLMTTGVLLLARAHSLRGPRVRAGVSGAGLLLRGSF